MSVPERKDGPVSLPFDVVIGAFNEVKTLTDERIAEVKQTRYVAEALPLQNELTVVLTFEAFEELGAGIRAAKHGQRLARIPHGTGHRQLVTYLYRMLETLTQIIKMDGDDTITRTSVALPQRSSHDVCHIRFMTFPLSRTRILSWRDLIHKQRHYALFFNHLSKVEAEAKHSGLRISRNPFSRPADS